MNIIPNLQFIIIATLLAAILFIAIAVIFYKLGKREKPKIINERNKVIKKENEVNPRPIDSHDNKTVVKEESKIINKDNKLRENNPTTEKRISLQELYSKRIDREINNTEINNKSEGDRFSDFKFLKYTSKGYKPAKGDKESRVVRWR